MKRDDSGILFWSAVFVSLVFTLVIWLLNPLLNDIVHLPDMGASWYYWKLPEPTLWSRGTAWGGYILHQLFVWFMVISRIRGEKNSLTGTRWNLMMLSGNFVFMLLHLGQTHLFYDGLAQDVSVWSSQWSVILMLSFVLVLLAPRRGLVFGKKWSIKKDVIGFIRKYHGFYISWALVYTFWFHPMDGDPRLLFGFMYMFFLFTQMSMAGTRAHRKITWITFLEVFVAAHGVTVALLSGQEMWPMFLFGFLMLFVLTQNFGFNWPRAGRVILALVYIAGVGIAYGYRGFGKLYELAFIPGTLYAVALVIILIVWGGLKLSKSTGS